ncbi:hypothetical protein Tco_1465762 [Tanacetum coccineum]
MKLTLQANEIHEKDEKLKRYRRIGMKAVKEKEQLQKTVDSWKDSSKNLWRLINSGMSSTSKIGLGYEIKSNDEEKDEEVELIVVPLAVRIPEEKDESRTSSTNSKKENSLMPELEIFHKPETGIFDEASYDEEGLITDFNSLLTEIEVSPTPTLRIHSIHPKSQILGDPKYAVQSKEQSGRTYLEHDFSVIFKSRQRNNHKRSNNIPGKKNCYSSASTSMGFVDHTSGMKIYDRWTTNDFSSLLLSSGSSSISKAQTKLGMMVYLGNLPLNWYALTTNPTIYDSLLKQFWQTATANTNVDGSLDITATIDTISFFTPQWRYLVHHLLHCISPKSGGWDQFGSNIATALVCLSTGRVYNFSKLIFDGMVANLKARSMFVMYPRFLQMILNIQTEDKHLYLAVSLTKKIFGNMKRGFRGAPRPLLPSMLLVATNQNAGQDHDAVAPSQPSSSALPTPTPTPLPIPTPTPTPPPIPTPTPTPLPIPTPTPTPLPIPTPTPTPPPIPTPTPTPPPISTPTPTPIPDTEPTPFEHIYEEPSPVHHHFSPPQEHVPSQMPMDDLLHEVPKLISRIEVGEWHLKHTKLTMGNAIVKLVKKVKKLEGFLKRRNLVLTDSEEEEPEAQGRKNQDDPQDSSVQGLVTPSTTKVKDFQARNKSLLLKERSTEKKRGKEKKVVSSWIFKKKLMLYAEGVNTGSIKLSTGDEKLSTGDEQVSTVGAKKPTSDQDKGQREGKAPMISEETPKKSKEQILQEKLALLIASVDTEHKRRAKLDASAELSKSNARIDEDLKERILQRKWLILSIKGRNTLQNKELKLKETSP